MIKVMVVDDQTLLKETLLFMLKQDETIEGYDGGQNGREALACAEANQPDVVLMDLRMPEMGGMEATKKLKKRYPNIKVVILTTFEDEERILESISIGADGYIVKDIKPEVLIMAVKGAHAGLYIMHRHVADIIKHRLTIDTKEKNHSEYIIGQFQLTDSDIEIIKLLADGKSNREIGEELSFTEGTIKNKVSRLLTKIDLKDRTQLVVFAIKENII
ncbi:MAG: response regulator transcription factor [Vallitaleaceae bacterium]|jgi:DNA-binding NarL/FixJ family response regulator|nr:response regulator transcription factor [Vallitaleaceae bacterium]